MTRSITTGTVLVITLIVLALQYCWHGHYILRAHRPGLRSTLLRKLLEKDHLFIPASNSQIHYVGRWTSNFNQLRQDAAFPGSYADLVVYNTTSLYVSLCNVHKVEKIGTASEAQAYIHQFTFRPSARNFEPAGQVSLVVQMNGEHYLHFPDTGFGLVAISKGGLDPTKSHRVRISHAGKSGSDILELEGFWLTKQGFLKFVPGTNAAETLRRQDQMDDYKGYDSAFEESSVNTKVYRKLFEVITDAPATLENPIKGNATSRDIRSMIYSWEKQLANTFDVDHVNIPTHDVCVTDKCTNTFKKHRPLTTRDLFFRSGPPSSPYYARHWPFKTYTPDVLLLNLGTNDFACFAAAANPENPTEVTNRPSLSTLIQSFTTAYITLVQSIRRSAYPLHPTFMHDTTNSKDGYTYNSAPSTLPIFIMIPFQAPPPLAHAIQDIIHTLRKEGDTSTFLLDTSGWLEDASDFSTPTRTSDSSAPTQKTLSAQGHGKVAAYMQMHLCHYLAEDPNECPFDRHDVYIGDVYVPQENELDKVVLGSKIRKMKDMFGIAADDE